MDHELRNNDRLTFNLADSEVWQDVRFGCTEKPSHLQLFEIRAVVELTGAWVHRLVEDLECDHNGSF